MPTSVRLDAKTESLVNRLARKTGRTKSEVIRSAIELLARSERASEVPTTAYEAMKDLIGSIRGGPRNLSERTGHKFRQLLLAKKRR